MKYHITIAHQSLLKQSAQNIIPRGIVCQGTRRMEQARDAGIGKENYYYDWVKWMWTTLLQVSNFPLFVSICKNNLDDTVRFHEEDLEPRLAHDIDIFLLPIFILHFKTRA